MKILSNQFHWNILSVGIAILLLITAGGCVTIPENNMKQVRAMYGNRLEENVFLRNLPLNQKQENMRTFAWIISPFEVPGLILLETALSPFQLMDFDLPSYPLTTFWIRTLTIRNAARMGTLMAEHPMGLSSIPLEKCLEFAYTGNREEALKRAEHLLTHANHNNQCYYIVPIRVFLLLGEKERAVETIHRYASEVYRWPITSPTDLAAMIPFAGGLVGIASDEAWTMQRDAIGLSLLVRYIFDRGYTGILDKQVMDSIKRINQCMPWQDGLDLTALEITTLNNGSHYQEALDAVSCALQLQEKRFEKNGRKDAHDFIVFNFAMATAFMTLPGPLYFRQSFRHAQSFPAHHMVLPDKYTLAVCYKEQIRSLCKLGRVSEAGNILRKLDEITRDRDWCRWIFFEGEFLHAVYTGDFELAANSDKRLVSDSLGKAHFSRLLQSGKEHGKTLEDAGRPDLALQSYLGVIDALDSMYRQAGEDTVFSESFNRQHLPFYESVIELMVSQKSPPRDILMMAERTKSRILSQLLLARFNEATGIIPEHRDEYQLLHAQYRAQRIQAAVLTDQEERKKAIESVDHIRNKIRKIEQLSGEKGGLRSGMLARLTARDIGKSFQAADITLVYWMGEKFSLCFQCMPSGEVTLQKLPPRRYFQQLVADYRNLLQDPASNPLESKDGHELAARLLPARINGQRILVIPDKELNILPFEALPSGDGYLMRNAEIAYAPSLSIAASQGYDQREATKTDLMLALADPDFGCKNNEKDSKGFATSFLRGGVDLARLPGTVKETEAIRNAFKDAAVLSGERATEQELRKTNLSRFRYIHFATHGLLGDDAIGPGEPALALAIPKTKDPKNGDGFLSASEIAQMELNADLVTLSGCNTASGKLSTGDGVVSLAAAFLSAGARSVVVSTWAVEDKATGELMSAFYHDLSRGHGTATSLREAKLALMKGSADGIERVRGMTEMTIDGSSKGKARPAGYSHPYYWAPFIYIGTFGK